MPKNRHSNVPIGDVLRDKRVRLGKGLRQMAGLLEITPPHLTDIEKGRRTPSEQLLVRICNLYGIDEAELRSGWNRPAAIVDEVANQNPMTAAKVPEFLREARRLTVEQWDSLIEQARRLASRKTRKPEK